MVALYSTATVPVVGGYDFTQTTPATVWTIVHNLNLTSPVVDCWVDVSGSMTKIIPSSVIVVDATTVQITFTTAYAGDAYVV